MGLRFAGGNRIGPKRLCAQVTTGKGGCLVSLGYRCRGDSAAALQPTAARAFWSSSRWVPHLHRPDRITRSQAFADTIALLRDRMTISNRSGSSWESPRTEWPAARAPVRRQQALRDLALETVGELRPERAARKHAIWRSMSLCRDSANASNGRRRIPNLFATAPSLGGAWRAASGPKSLWRGA